MVCVDLHVRTPPRAVSLGDTARQEAHTRAARSKESGAQNLFKQGLSKRYASRKKGYEWRKRPRERATERRAGPGSRQKGPAAQKGRKRRNRPARLQRTGGRTSGGEQDLPHGPRPVAAHLSTRVGAGALGPGPNRHAASDIWCSVGPYERRCNAGAMQQRGQCVARRAPSAGSPRRRTHWASAF